MRFLSMTISSLALMASMGTAAFAELAAELRVNNEMAPASGWAVITLQQGTEPRPVGSGMGGITFSYRGLPIFRSLFVSEPLLLVENTQGQVSFRIDQSGPEGVYFSFSSSVADVGLDNSRPFLYIALRVNPDIALGQQALMHLDSDRTVLYSGTGDPYPVSLRDGLFTAGGLSISCISPTTGLVRAGQGVTVFGVGFPRDSRVDLEFNGVSAPSRVLDAHTIVTTAPFDFMADSVEIKVRGRVPGPNGELPHDTFVLSRFGCFQN